MSYISKLRAITTRRDKIFLLILLFMSIVLSIIETVGITAIMPFISTASNPTLITENSYYKSVYDFLGFGSTTQFVISFGVVLILFYIFRGIYTVYYIYLLSKFSFGRYHVFAYKLLQNYIEMPYKEFVNKNSSTLTKTIVNEAQNTTTSIQQFLMIFAELFTIIMLYAMLIVLNWKMALVLTAILGVKVLFLTKTISNTMKKLGVKRAESQNSFYKILGQAFGNFKFIKLKCIEPKVLSEFAVASRQYSNINIYNNTLQVLPRTILEGLGFGLMVAIVIYVLIQTSDASAIIPVISMYALALYRILPAINRIMSNFNSAMYHSKALEIVHEDLMYDPEVEGDGRVDFKSKIELKNINFSYNGEKDVLKNINLTINKGEKVAFVGPSGSGKSTLVDLVIGIYKPRSGTMLVDGKEIDSENIRSWRQKIGYIPQSIYLFDGSVAENVAFGEDIDGERVTEVLKKANIYDFLQKEADGIYTKVGEGGIKLSGGQKQRVGIARALYSNPEVLVLDEATSALDNETESKIMDEIYSISDDKTLLVIAHRLSTVDRCERVVDMEWYKNMGVI